MFAPSADMSMILQSMTELHLKISLIIGYVRAANREKKDSTERSQATWNYKNRQSCPMSFS